MYVYMKSLLLHTMQLKQKLTTFNTTYFSSLRFDNEELAAHRAFIPLCPRLFPLRLQVGRQSINMQCTEVEFQMMHATACTCGYKHHCVEHPPPLSTHGMVLRINTSHCIFIHYNELPEVAI